jgi:hypothetical protein
MLIMAAFEYSTELEQALLTLEGEGIERRGIMVVHLDSPNQDRSVRMEPLPDWKQRSFEIGMASGTACAVVGISHGFITEWGPLIWGLLSAIGGFLLGYGVYAILHFKLWKRRTSGRHPEAVVIVRAGKGEESLVRQVLWRYHALSVGVVANQQVGLEQASVPTTSA